MRGCGNVKDDPDRINSIFKNGAISFDEPFSRVHFGARHPAEVHFPNGKKLSTTAG